MLFPGDLSRDERAVLQAAYDTLTAIGSRNGWDYYLLDEAHQKLGVILAVLIAKDKNNAKGASRDLHRRRR